MKEFGEAVAAILIGLACIVFMLSIPVIPIIILLFFVKWLFF